MLAAHQQDFHLAKKCQNLQIFCRVFKLKFAKLNLEMPFPKYRRNVLEKDL